MQKLSTIKLLLYYFAIFTLIFSCKKAPSFNHTKHLLQIDTISTQEASIVAESIIYDVEIKNYLPEDTWKEECLSGIKTDSLFHILYKLIENEQVLVYDFYEGNLISKVEFFSLLQKENITNTTIGKIQFTEKWMIHEESGQFIKKVENLVLGLEVIKNQQVYFKPLAKIVMN